MVGFQKQFNVQIDAQIDVHFTVLNRCHSKHVCHSNLAQFAVDMQSNCKIQMSDSKTLEFVDISWLAGWKHKKLSLFGAE